MPAWLGVFKTFGFFVALSFLAAAKVTTDELKRKERQGLLKPVRKKIKVKVKPEDGGPAVTTEKDALFYPHQLITEIVFAAAIGGIIGAKLFNLLFWVKTTHLFSEYLSLFLITQAPNSETTSVPTHRKSHLIQLLDATDPRHLEVSPSTCERGEPRPSILSTFPRGQSRCRISKVI